jgi:1-phosphofructokinase family hexose kinase
MIAAMLLTLGLTPAVQKSMTFARLTIDAVNRTADVSRYASGKSINAARVLTMLNEPVLTIGVAGGDAGRFMLADLDRIGVAHDFAAIDAETRTCVTLIDKSNGTATELVEESKPVPESAYADVLHRLTARLPEAAGLLLAGSLTPGGPAGFYADAVTAAKAAGKFVLLDASGEPLRHALAARPDVVKPNRHELAATAGVDVNSDDALRDAIRVLVSQGPAWAVVTAGGGATVVSDGREFWTLATPQVPVVSPIGSGDSFAAGLLAGVARGQSVPEACRLAVACGAANAMTAKAGHVRRVDLHEIVPRVTLARWA